ncbi:MAG: ethanolamine utilization protein EutN [Anaerolinea sp.]|nr:ethanolamine utilization protein EutN [Anaerolinea sp.]
MLLGSVRGTAICSVKYPGMDGLKLLLVQPLNKNLDPIGILQVAVDTTHAGHGDICLMVRSREACMALNEPCEIPIDLALVSIVDQHTYNPDCDFDFVMKYGWTSYS